MFKGAETICFVVTQLLCLRGCKYLWCEWKWCSCPQIWAASVLQLSLCLPQYSASKAFVFAWKKRQKITLSLIYTDTQTTTTEKKRKKKSGPSLIPANSGQLKVELLIQLLIHCFCLWVLQYMWSVRLPAVIFHSDAASPLKGLKVKLPLVFALCSVAGHGEAVLHVCKGSCTWMRINRVFKCIFNFYLQAMLYYQLDDKMSWIVDSRAFTKLPMNAETICFSGRLSGWVWQRQLFEKGRFGWWTSPLFLSDSLAFRGSTQAYYRAIKIKLLFVPIILIWKEDGGMTAL